MAMPVFPEHCHLPDLSAQNAAGNALQFSKTQFSNPVSQSVMSYTQMAQPGGPLNLDIYWIGSRIEITGMDPGREIRY